MRKASVDDEHAGLLDIDGFDRRKLRGKWGWDLGRGTAVLMGKIIGVFWGVESLDMS
jgi:hypothetical protein